jgi:hypothetical protein
MNEKFSKKKNKRELGEEGEVVWRKKRMNE